MLSRKSDIDCYTHDRLDYHATVRELPSNERPRERLAHFGPQALSLAELLAIVLRTGTRSDNALELANKLLSKYRGLPGLVCADFRELCAEYGMGEAKSAHPTGQAMRRTMTTRRIGTMKTGSYPPGSRATGIRGSEPRAPAPSAQTRSNRILPSASNTSGNITKSRTWLPATSRGYWGSAKPR